MKIISVECVQCNCIDDADEMISFDGDFYCSDCYDNIPRCDRCGDLRSRDTGLLYTNDDYILCTYCYEHYTTSCGVCGNTYYYESNTDECCDSSTMLESDRDCIQSYGITSAIRMYKCDDVGEDNTSLFFGVELEFSGVQTDTVFQSLAPKLAAYDTYFKEDSSLCDDCDDVYGAEIALQPATYEWFKRDGFDIKHVISHLNRAGLYASSELCGLHIHVNRSYFEGLNIPELLYKSKLKTLVGNLSEELQELSGRSDFYWCSFDDVCDQSKLVKEQTTDEKKICKAFEMSFKRKSSRYYAVNFSPIHTIEFRFFAGTDNYNDILSNIKLIKDICEFVANHDILECISINSIEEMRGKLCV